MNFYLDGWYATKALVNPVADWVRRQPGVRGVTIIRRKSENTYGVLYVSDRPLSENHTPDRWAGRIK